MNVVISFKMSGLEIIKAYLEAGRKQELNDEIRKLKADCRQAKKGRQELKDFDSEWSSLETYPKINKGKRFKEYVRRGIITGIEIESDKANQSVVYNIL